MLVSSYLAKVLTCQHTRRNGTVREGSIGKQARRDSGEVEFKKPH